MVVVIKMGEVVVMAEKDWRNSTRSSRRLSIGEVAAVEVVRQKENSSSSSSMNNVTI